MFARIFNGVRSIMNSLPPIVEQLLGQPGAGQSVVFDADGTLWRGDVGEDFLRYLAAGRLLPCAPSEGVYAAYERLNAIDATASYAYAVTIMAGMFERDVVALANRFVTQRFTGRVYPYVRPLLARLAAQHFDVWVCSASARWVVEAGAAVLGIAPDHVIAVDAELDQELRLTSRILEPVTAGPGKVEWLRRKKLAPVLAVGNGDFDLDMLAFARHGWVIAPPDAAPSALVREAQARNWPISRV